MRWMPDAIPSQAARGGSSGPEPAPRRSAIMPTPTAVPRGRSPQEQEGGLMRTHRRWRVSVPDTVLLTWLALALLNVVWRVPAEVVVGAGVVSVVAIVAVAVRDRCRRASQRPPQRLPGRPGGAGAG